MHHRIRRPQKPYKLSNCLINHSYGSKSLIVPTFQWKIHGEKFMQNLRNSGIATYLSGKHYWQQAVVYHFLPLANT